MLSRRRLMMAGAAAMAAGSGAGVAYAAQASADFVTVKDASSARTCGTGPGWVRRGCRATAPGWGESWTG